MIKSIGIIGGGQLGKMLAVSAVNMGYCVNVLDTNKQCPASSVANVIVGRLDDESAIEQLCKISDVITYEFENIPAEIIEKLSKTYNIPQGHLPLMYSQDRVIEKNSARSCSVATAPFMQVDCYDDLIKSAEQLKYPFIVKTRKFGYDGQGQVVINNDEQLSKASNIVGVVPCIAEGFVDFACEVSQIAVRSRSGEMRFFPLPSNTHINNILHISKVPSILEVGLIDKISACTRQIMEGLNLFGILSVEYFITKQGEVIFNEMAPRPHNSGHYTIEGCITSQFEQLIRCITNTKLGDTNLKHNTVMINILGQDMNKIADITKEDIFSRGKLHLYGKDEAKFNRKMGHLTFVDITDEQLSYLTGKYWGNK